MTGKLDIVLPLDNAKEVVMSFIKALNDEDFRGARNFVNESMTFDGVLGSRIGAESYFNDMERMRLKYDVIKAFVDGDDVCLLYDLDMSGTILFGCGWYHLDGGKISSLKVVFDPRPVLEMSDKN